MNDLAEFLLARIAEDEDVAKRAAFGYGAAWRSETDDAEDWSVVHADGQRDMVGSEDGDITRHIARHDPAHVLADCAWRHLVVEQYVTAMKDARVHTDAAMSLQVKTVAHLLRWMATPYRDHPDYRGEWRP